MAKTVATILGILFVLLGILGFLAPDFMGTHLSVAHNVIHLVSGAIALYFGLTGTLSGAKLFDIVFGVIYLLLGVVGFIAGKPGIPTIHGATGMGMDTRLFKIVPGVLELGTMDHAVHIVLGIVFLVAALATRVSVSRAVEQP